ncbi:MAG: ribonuclease P protein component [Lachnospiraceae bacterium]|nr:ribonuclease P protein component [Lachnospiraceae bacterium]
MEFSESLKKNRDFQNVYRTGKSFANKLLVMYVLENNQQKNFLGISVSKKVGNSVVRHRLKRLIYESYRLHESMFNSGLNIVVIARNSSSSASYKEVESALLHLSRLHGILHVYEKNIDISDKKV